VTVSPAESAYRMTELALRVVHSQSTIDGEESSKLREGGAMTDVVRAPSASRRTAVGRAVVLAALGAGFWLLGQAGASADDGTAGIASALTGDAVAPVVSQTQEAVSAVTSVAAATTSPAVVPPPDTAPVPAAIPRSVQHSQDLVRTVTATVAEPAGEIVLAAGAVVDDVAVVVDDAVAVVDRTSPEADVVEEDPVLDLVRDLVPSGAGQPVGEVSTVGVPTVAAPTGKDLPQFAAVGIGPFVERPSAPDVVALTSDVLVARADRSGTDEPAPAPALPVDAPSRTALTSSSFLDQLTADLAALPPAGRRAACLIAAGADGAVGGLPLDPSFSPD
jgi:hypothetical protein